MRRFTQPDREEVRCMFKLHDIRESKIWQEAHKEGREEGWEVGREEGESLIKQVVQQKLRKGMSTKEVAAMLEISLAEVRRFAR